MISITGGNLLADGAGSQAENAAATSASTTTGTAVDAPRAIMPDRPEVDMPALASARQTRLRTVVDDLDLDALVMLTAAGVQYASGYRSVGADLYASHQMAAVLTRDDCWLICPAGDSAAAADAGIRLDRIVPFGTFFFESVDESPLSTDVGRHPTLDAALRFVVGAIGSRDMRWGVEGLAPGHAVGDRVTLVDATAAIGRICARKLPGEVELIRYAARLTEAAMASAVEAATEGATEKEVADHVAAGMVAGGGSPRFIVAGTGPRSALSDSFATRRSWQRGEVLRLDAGCVVDGYWSDLGRTVVLGEPSQVQLVRYEALLAGQDAAFEALRPGVTGRELFEAAVRTVNGHGLPYRRQHCGHGIGLEIYEAPMVSPAGDTAIDVGTTLCIETPYYELGWAGMMVEDTVLVTDAGFQRLNLTDRRLWVALP
ncbi:M24 family metallopeptidase [Kribbella sp. NPDC050124]|uniref:M24 family metallopeptidase n=1 Tax=Kribbella sp. NPDC050124 TaxID=3364114 RepID=UPI0037A23DB9